MSLFSETTTAQSRLKLAEIVKRGKATIVPGAANALNARIIEDLGFEAFYLTGAGIANSQIGLPDVGLVSVSELAETAARINDVCSLPMIVDADTGFGNAVNVYRTVRMLERSGASALQIEDQIFPKKCGHFAGKAVVPLEEITGKIKAAVDARSDERTLIIARTDARAVEGFDRAIERAHALLDAGADILFVEAPESKEEMRRIGSLPAPQVANLVIGGKTPMLELDELEAMGFSLILYANAALQATMHAVQQVLRHLRDNGSLSGMDAHLTTFVERQRLIGKPAFDELEKRYAES